MYISHIRIMAILQVDFLLLKASDPFKQKKFNVFFFIPIFVATTISNKSSLDSATIALDI